MSASVMTQTAIRPLGSTLFTGYQRCECGAITLITDTGETYSVNEDNLEIYLPGMDVSCLEEFQKVYCCDHCVNHYGIDLCGCGSGEPFGECDNGLDECQFPMQLIGGYTHI